MCLMFILSLSSLSSLPNKELMENINFTSLHTTVTTGLPKRTINVLGIKKLEVSCKILDITKPNTI